MKILIVSDTHRRDGNLTEVLEMEKPFDCLIHLGDAEGSEDYIRELAECPVHIVCGNNDFFCDLPKEEEFMLGNYKVLITHGHYYYVSLDTQELRTQAEVRGVDIAMLGHTQTFDRKERRGDADKSGKPVLSTAGRKETELYCDGD